jgi:signal transduction histidine kinase
VRAAAGRVLLFYTCARYQKTISGLPGSSDLMTETPEGDRPFLVLLVESRPGDREQVRRAFDRYNRELDARQRPEDGCHSIRCRGFELRTADSLETARRQCVTLDPDLLIVNLQQPDGDGLELMTEPASHSCPVLVTSDRHGELMAVQAMKGGAMDYVVKSATRLAALPELAETALREWEIVVEHQRLQLEMAELPQREQQRLGHELHDGLGQQLTGLGLLAKSLARRLGDAGAREREMAEQLTDGLEQALAEVRVLARGLIPVQTDARGLVSALEELAARMSELSGVQIELRHENPILISDNETATHVYRIVQEAITNSIKHSEADSIVLLLEADDHEAIVEVRDNGRGLPENVHRSGGLGLRTMFHRCRLFGGSLDIYTHDDGGTRVRCCFPLHAETGAG